MEFLFNDTRPRPPTHAFQLRDLILYHALGDELYSNDLVDDLVIRTLNYQGDRIRVELGDPPKVNGESVILVDRGQVDISLRNGVVHAVDAGKSKRLVVS